jgi:hypothetical protein
MSVDEWEHRVVTERRAKDAYFASHPQSPIPRRDRQRFRGLAYWPPDPRYRYELELREHSKKKIVKVVDTYRQIRKLWRWGEFRFRIGDRECALQAYRSEPDDGRLFVPFKDATSGAESYGAGRYLDLNPAEDVTQEGKWVFDLNAAYNPWCAYSDDYACPVVPPENWLKALVRAGEKKYPLGKNQVEK